MRILPALSCLFLIAACGSGDGTFEEPQDAAQTTNGFVVIEERLGRQVLDAWFSRIPMASDSAELLWQNGPQRCERLAALSLSGGVSFSDAMPYTVSSWRETLFAGDIVNISSRAGTIIELRAQYYGNAVMYAPDDRWLDSPLSEDARLSVPGSEEFPAFESVALSPMAPLVREQPLDGVQAALSDPIAWQAAGEVGNGIELMLSSAVDLSGGLDVLRIRCALDDSGSFTLPEAALAAIPQAAQTTVSLVRKRETRYYAGDATLTVVQISYP